MNKKKLLTIVLLCLAVVGCNNNAKKMSISFENNQLTETSYELAQKHYGNQDYENAIEYYLLALKESSDILDEYWIKGQLARSYLQIGDYEQVRLYIEEAVAGYQQNGETKNGYSFICQTSGIYYFRTAQYEAALKCFEQSLQYAEFQDREVVATYIEMANTYAYLDKDENAMEYYDKAVQLAEEINNNGGLSNAYNAEGIFHAERGETDISHECFSKGLEYAILAWGENSFKTADTYKLLAKNYSLKNEYNNAIEATQKTLNIYNDLNGPFEYDRALAYTNLGYLYIKVGDNEAALENLKQAYNIAEVNKESNKMIDDLYEDGLSQVIQYLYEKSEKGIVDYEDWFEKNFAD